MLGLAPDATNVPPTFTPDRRELTEASRQPTTRPLPALLFQRFATGRSTNARGTRLGTFENQAKGIVTRRDETAKPARASGTRGVARLPEAGRWNLRSVAM
jgi:hypothetical protein